MKSLVGYTGFVGSNIAATADFDNVYNSTNFGEAYGTKPDLLVYAGVRAEMFLANSFPEKDFEQMKEALENIKEIEPRQLVLISTISVYGENTYGDEDTVIDESKLTAYGKNRLWLEKQVEGSFQNHLIVRLPALYGINLKKNFIYDYIHLIPALLKYEKFEELLLLNDKLGEFYEKQDTGFYKCRELDSYEYSELKAFFKACGFTALNFTDSRSRYQFYNLSFLWNDIKKALGYGLKKLNITSEPIGAGELYMALEGKKFVNEIAKSPFDYDLRSKYAELFGGRDGYLFDKQFVMEDIKKFVKGERNEREVCFS